MFKAILCGVLAALLVLPASALAHDKGSVQHKNQYLRAKVIKLHGERAPGRNIVKQGLRNGKKPSYKKIRAYFNQMRQMILPKPAARYVSAGKPYQAPAGTATARATGAPLASIRACETRGQPNPYSTNTGNGFYGAYQFTPGTWQSVGGSGNPAAASPAEQDKRAAILYSQRGAQPWPVCGR
jgi:hypothetical protein